ncbi:hypothetical protein JOE69_003025 [Arthrobacter russicus]|uniref:Histidine kinase n=1 Tax=Arthrobacter russicus TaxID=172040 RepID=A0ABU1JEE5_9MICC|nr:hypothetical protein [Arthrobacter russicus]
MSEFWSLMDDEFGAGYARSLGRDLVLTDVGGRSALEALEAGIDPKAVWLAVCDAKDVPLQRRLGKDRKPKR